jgi:glycosyltransferase involved in cell wall biosynthesis
MKFSVVIPTYNRPGELARCLSALAGVDYPKGEFEVIVVDDGSRMDLEPVVAQYRAVLPVTLIRQLNGGPGPARNYGAANASGSVFAFIDDDCEPESGWLRAMDAAVARAPHALIGGCVRNGLPDNPNSSASHQIIDFYDRHFNRDPLRAHFFASNNIAMPADLYREVGGFDPAFQAAEDRDLCDRWLRRGWPLIAAQDAVVFHSRRMSFRDFWRQHIAYGRGAFAYATARRQRSSGPVPFEGLAVHLRLIASPIRESFSPRSFYVSFLIVVSQVATVIGYAAEARARKRRTVLVESCEKASSDAE